MASTISLTAIDWITNQSCSRLAAFLMTSHTPREVGTASSLGFDKFDMAVLRDRRYAVTRNRNTGSGSITPR